MILTDFCRSGTVLNMKWPLSQSCPKSKSPTGRNSESQGLQDWKEVENQFGKKKFKDFRKDIREDGKDRKVPHSNIASLKKAAPDEFADFEDSMDNE